MKKLLLIITFVLAICCNAFAGKNEIIEVNVGDTFTLNVTEYEKYNAIQWNNYKDYSEYFEPVGEYGDLSTSMTFKALKPNDLMRVAAVYIYINSDGFTRSDIDYWTIYVREKSQDPIKDDTRVTLSTSSMEIQEGERATLKANGFTSKLGGDRTFSWKSADENVVRIIEDTGSEITIEGVKNGSTEISVSWMGKSAACDVTVTKNNNFEDFYLVGTNTVWYFNDNYYQFSTDDGENYTLYLDYLSSEFRIATPGWDSSYGLNDFDEFGLGKTFILENHSTNNLKASKFYENVKLTFKRSTHELYCENALRPQDASSVFHKVKFTSDGIGYVCRNVLDGSRVPFFIASVDGWRPVSFIADDSFGGEFDFNSDYVIYTTPSILNDCVIGVIFEYTPTDTAYEHTANIKANYVDGKVEFDNIQNDVDVTEYGDSNSRINDAIALGSKSKYTTDVPVHGMKIVEFSNGQKFKIVR